VTRRLGIFGGTFDPVHVGHLILAQEALEQLDLDRLWFLPASRPAHKRARAITPVSHRIAMLRHAVRGNPRFTISRIEADQDGPSFTVTTLERLARTERADLSVLMGQDSLEEFRTWREPDRILALARLVVAPRGERAPRLDAATRRRVVFLDQPRIGIASSDIRRRLRRGAAVRYWVPDPVLSYIRRHGLYRPSR
jgi:nicotinate-nucleotide adenylyltransferase